MEELREKEKKAAEDHDDWESTHRNMFIYGELDTLLERTYCTIEKLDYLIMLTELLLIKENPKLKELIKHK